jgi:hypothetical protein
MGELRITSLFKHSGDKMKAPADLPAASRFLWFRSK